MAIIAPVVRIGLDIAKQVFQVLASMRMSGHSCASN